MCWVAEICILKQNHLRSTEYSKSCCLKESAGLCCRFIMGFSIIISQSGRKCIINQAESAVTHHWPSWPWFPISVCFHSCRCSWYNPMCAERPGSHFPPHCSTFTASRRGKTRGRTGTNLHSFLTLTPRGFCEAFCPISGITAGYKHYYFIGLMFPSGLEFTIKRQLKNCASVHNVKELKMCQCWNPQQEKTASKIY